VSLSFENAVVDRPAIVTGLLGASFIGVAFLGDVR
jgi:hypothetical protein